MQAAPDATLAQPAPLRVARRFPAPRETVFRAWSSAGHVKAWFCPTGYTVPEARVELRQGGAFEVCMRAPDGVIHWTRGQCVEVAPPARLVLDLRCEDAAGTVLFEAWTEVDFIADAGGTRMEVLQRYIVADARFAWMPAGAPAGWAQTLDKLTDMVARLQGGEAEPPACGDLAPGQEAPATRSVAHGVFHLERVYDASAGRLFHALSDVEAKARWFAAPAGEWTLIERRLDFRVGGSERLQGRWQSGLVTTFDALYHDIVPDERIVYSYAMHMDARKISVSLATLQLRPVSATRTTLLVTEQGAFLDGYDDAGSREHGTGVLLDRLGASLTA